ncbi:hypothetical protein ACFX2A_000191 [Malus domestica]
MASLSVTATLSSSIHSLVFPRSPPALHPPCSVPPAWRIVSSIEAEKRSILRLLDPNLALSASASKYKVFCLKMKGDYHRCTKFKPTCCSSTAAIIEHASSMLRSRLQV